MSVRVRPATLQDGVAVLALLEDVGYYPEPIQYAQTYRKTLTDPHFLVRVAEEDWAAFDLVVLGGMNESTWPRAAGTDPWFSRPMRASLGLEQPERGIGLSAHDFAIQAAGPSVLLSRALKADGAPTIASRWLDPGETEAAITPFMVLYAIHDALVKPMPAGPNTPSLAESWTASPDGTTYDFLLRAHAKFHVGSPVTAEDV
jgi:hypothetical protein